MNLRTPVAILFVLFIISSCKKNTAKDGITEKKAIDSGLYENVKLLDSLQLKLNNDTIKQKKGIYSYSILSKSPDIDMGDIIVGVDNLEGYIRKVKAVSINGKQLTLTTDEARLEDVFKNVWITLTNVSSGEAYLPGSKQREAGIKTNALTRDDIYLYGSENSTLQAKLAKLHVNFDPDFNIHIKFGDHVIDHIDIGFDKKTTIETHAQLELIAKKRAELHEKFELAKFTKSANFFIPIGGAPFPLRLTTVTTVGLNLSAEIAGDAKCVTEVDYLSKITAGLNYDAGKGWTQTYSFTGKPSLTGGINVATVSGEVKADLVINFALKLYGFRLPNIEPAINTYVTANSKINSGDWDTEAGIAGGLKLGLQDGVLNNIFKNYRFEYHTDTLKYIKPYELRLVSGDQQKLNLPGKFSEPIRAIVLNNIGDPVADVPVHIKVTTGNGKTPLEIVRSDKNGLVSTSWSSIMSGPQVIEMSVFKSDGKPIKNTPLIFNAQVGAPPELCIGESGADIPVPGGPAYTVATGGTLYTKLEARFYPCINGKQTTYPVSFYYENSPDQLFRTRVDYVIKCSCTLK